MSHSDRYRYWRLALVLFGCIALTSGLFRGSGFWRGYALDIFGPAWNYILFRGLFTNKRRGALSRFLTPEVVLIFIAGVCFAIETAQYLRLYDSYFDPYDFLAYVSLLVPCYVIDRWLLNRDSRS